MNQPVEERLNTDHLLNQLNQAMQPLVDWIQQIYETMSRVAEPTVKSIQEKYSDLD
jgi:hypothetical protein